MKKNKKLGCITLLMISPFTMAMQPMDDQNLSDTTGQSGISVGVGVSNVQVNQVSIIDRDGLGTTPDYTNAASLVFAGNNPSNIANQSANVTFVGAQPNKSVMNFIVDTDGGSGNPFANIAVGFDSSISGLKISPFALYLASAAAGSNPTTNKSIFLGTSKNPGVTKILTMDNGLDINFGNSKPVFNIQLGNAPQSRMITFSGAIQSICASGTGCPISLLSDDSTVGANFNFQLNATDPVAGFSLKGFYAGVDPSGFVFGDTGTSSKFNVGINNLLMGTAGTSNSTGAFANIQNGPMGNFGAIGTSVTDLKMRVSGL